MYGGKINKVVSSSKKSSQLADISYVELSGAVGKNICEKKPRGDNEYPPRGVAANSKNKVI